MRAVFSCSPFTKSFIYFYCPSRFFFFSRNVSVLSSCSLVSDWDIDVETKLSVCLLKTLPLEKKRNKEKKSESRLGEIHAG